MQFIRKVFGGGSKEREPGVRATLRPLPKGVEDPHASIVGHYADGVMPMGDVLIQLEGQFQNPQERAEVAKKIESARTARQEKLNPTNLGGPQVS